MGSHIVCFLGSGSPPVGAAELLEPAFLGLSGQSAGGGGETPSLPWDTRVGNR